MSSQSGPQRLSMSYKNQHFSNGGLGSDCRPRQVPIGTMARSTQKQSLSLIRAYSPHARVRVQVTLVTLLSPSRLPLVSSGGSFWACLGPAGEMALRRLLGGQSGHFWGLLAKWLSGNLWGVILNGWPTIARMRTADLHDFQCHTKTNTLATVSDLKGHAGHRLSPPS